MKTRRNFNLSLAADHLPAFNFRTGEMETYSYAVGDDRIKGSYATADAAIAAAAKALSGMGEEFIHGIVVWEKFNHGKYNPSYYDVRVVATVVR